MMLENHKGITLLCSLKKSSASFIFLVPCSTISMTMLDPFIKIVEMLSSSELKKYYYMHEAKMRIDTRTN